jgi:hypothetical protein
MIRAALIAIIGAGFWGSANGQITTVPSVGTGISFQVQSGGAAATQSLTVSTTFGPTTLMIGVPANQTWLTVNGSPAGTFIFVPTPATIAVAVSPAGLTAQSIQVLSANISIAIYGQPASQIYFPVTLTVIAPSLLVANPGALTFTAVQGASVGVPSSIQVSIGTLGSPVLGYSVTASTHDGGGWLLLFGWAGTTPILPGPGVQVRVNPSGLTRGVYSGTILVQSATTSDSVTIPVTLTVSAALPTTPAPSTLVLLTIGAMICGMWLRFRT